MAERRHDSSNRPAGRRPGGAGLFSTPLAGLASWRPRHAANDNRTPVRLRLARLLFVAVIAGLAGLTIWLS